ncbi:NAD(P)H-binding protein [Phytoactinopolyspora alkaliphila]|uniref:NAD(P)H-binding protein n=1 Tax=Phytoactinopolyspora alkaliphila TaxID=1783498 RepID=A0A6N9YKX8_9ACTN|nr:NAD(P)H-binding protein [Phytoactinopolyspora alkaliphila]NED95508.1 NAD(P)H-binding protein [Phytoactinopolyspora alkaliphila]
MRILVTGATGNIGRLVVDHLLTQGAEDVRALTINPAKAALPADVEVAVGYVGRPATLPEALDGVDRMYLAPVPETVADAVRLARKAGVEHIVDLSGPEGTWWYGVAQAVESSGAAWTHLWPGEFMSNTLIWADQVRTARVVRDAYPDAANAPIDIDDVAAVAAKTLLEDGHAGQSYELTGPHTLTRREMVRHIGAALGRDIPYVALTREEGIAQLVADMGEYAEWYVDGAASLVDEPQAATTTVADILGRPATTFAEWAVKHADEFR